MILNQPDHEKLFDEICNKLQELSNQPTPAEDSQMQNHGKIEKMQTQIKKFQNDLEFVQKELTEKVKNLDNVQILQSDLHSQLKNTSEQLNNERALNTRLNAELTKSLEFNLQLQLEIQQTRTRNQQNLQEEQKQHQNLVNELNLVKALKDELETELHKTKGAYAIDQDVWQKEIEKMCEAFEQIETASAQKSQALNTLMETAEAKIAEMKLALDRKHAESQDYYSHLQQALTQTALLKQENSSLKDYIQKMNASLTAPASQFGNKISNNAPQETASV